MNQTNALLSSKRMQKGFSLVEVLVAVVILAFVFAALARVFLTTVKSDARYTEQTETMNRNSVVTEMLSEDFADSQRLFVSSPIPSTGTFPLNFVSHPDYQLAPGAATRTGSTNTAPLRSELVLKQNAGAAKVSFVPATAAVSYLGWHTLNASDSENYQVIEITPADRTYRILGPAGGVLNAGAIPPGTQKISAVVERLSIGCRLAFFAALSDENSVLLYRSEAECPAFPLETVAAVQAASASISGVELSGSFEPRASQTSQNRQFAPLPYVGSTQIKSPVFLNPENGDLVLFRADDNSDKSYLQGNASFFPAQTSVVTVKTGTRGSFERNGFVFVVDYLSLNSVVCQIQDVQPAGSSSDLATLTLTPVFTPSGAAWSMFYSRPADFVGVDFPQGAEVVNLSAPVSYRYLASESVLLRREGSGAWQTVTPGVSGFDVSIIGDYLNVSINLQTEGIETDNLQPAQTTRLSIPIK